MWYARLYRLLLVRTDQTVGEAFEAVAWLHQLKRTWPLVEWRHFYVIGPIPWSNSGPLCHALSLSLSSIVGVVVDIDAHRRRQ